MPIEDTIVTFGAFGPAKIIADGGSQAWRLWLPRARECKYYIAAQNQSPLPPLDAKLATEPHQSAFLVGKISAIKKAPLDKSRWLIGLSEYARVSIPNFWHWRCPVRYMAFEETGIDMASLQWHPVSELPDPEPDLGLTFEAARHGLANHYHVEPDRIEIILHG